jgi:acetyl esterase/lipase
MQGMRAFKEGPTFAWVRLGEVAVKAGKHTLEISITQPKGNGQFLISQDCFVIVPKKPLGDLLENYPFKLEAEKPSRRAIFLWDGKSPGTEIDDGFRPWIEPYPIKTSKPLGAVLVFPGGAYVARTPFEGSPVAKRFNEMGSHAFVVQYRVAPHTLEEALADGQRAVRLIRAKAALWNVAPDRIAVCGFSAGGHLSGSLGITVLKGDADAKDPIDRCSSRPDAIILSYAPSSFDDNKDLPADFPPVFAWQTGEDSAVKADNLVRIGQALQKNNTPFEMHLFPHGPHGMGLAGNDRHAAQWTKLCGMWLEELGWKK